MQTIQHPHPLASASPEAMAVIDALDPLLCTRQELQELISSTNDNEVHIRAYLFGIADCREQLALITTGTEEF